MATASRELKKASLQEMPRMVDNQGIQRVVWFNCYDENYDTVTNLFPFCVGNIYECSSLLPRIFIRRLEFLLFSSYSKAVNATKKSDHDL